MIQFTVLYLRAVFGALTHQSVRPYLLVVAGLLAIGAVFYSVVEGWHPLDAAYFSVATLSTVGYGDVAPRTNLGKLFTMVYILIGLGVLGTFIATVAKVSMGLTEREEQQAHARHGAENKRSRFEAEHQAKRGPVEPSKPTAV